jgi:hypothetical protein
MLLHTLLLSSTCTLTKSYFYSGVLHVHRPTILATVDNNLHHANYLLTSLILMDIPQCIKAILRCAHSCLHSSKYIYISDLSAAGQSSTSKSLPSSMCIADISSYSREGGYENGSGLETVGSITPA